MVSLMQRRRMMLQLQNVLPEWDYIWDYTMGLPEDNGWIKTIHKTINAYTPRSTLTSDGVKLEARPTSAYVMYSNPTDYNTLTGVLETKMRVKRRASNEGGMGLVSFGDGNNGLAVIFSSTSGYINKIYINDASARADQTQIGTYSSNVFKVIKIVLNNGVGSVYIGGALAIDNIDVSQMVNYADTQIRAGFGEFTNHYAEYQYIKMKIGRL